MEKTFTFNLTEQKVNMILQGLGELPAKTSMPLIIELQNEAQKQLQGPVREAEKIEEKEDICAEE